MIVLPIIGSFMESIGTILEKKALKSKILKKSFIHPRGVTLLNYPTRPTIRMFQQQEREWSPELQPAGIALKKLPNAISLSAAVGLQRWENSRRRKYPRVTSCLSRRCVANALPISARMIWFFWPFAHLVFQEMLMKMLKIEKVFCVKYRWLRGCLKMFRCKARKEQNREAYMNIR